uniref:Ras-related protein Rab n=1 Tax=Clastoptera arizonana TaxID=38151 RepID=A0A1B6CA05_9HEMI
MFKRVLSGEQSSVKETTSQDTQEGSPTEVKVKAEKPKKKFVASLKKLGSTVGLKMNKQPKTFTDSTQSSELKKKKSKKQRSEAELKTSESLDGEQSTTGTKPKASKVASNIVKKLSVDHIYQPFIGQQYTPVTTSPPVSPKSDVKSTSSSEISYDSPVHTGKTPEMATTSKVIDKPAALEDLILQTQQLVESLPSKSPERSNKTLHEEFIEAEYKNNPKVDRAVPKSRESRSPKKRMESNVTNNKSDERDNKQVDEVKKEDVVEKGKQEVKVEINKSEADFNKDSSLENQEKNKNGKEKLVPVAQVKGMRKNKEEPSGDDKLNSNTEKLNNQKDKESSGDAKLDINAEKLINQKENERSGNAKLDSNTDKLNNQKDKENALLTNNEKSVVISDDKTNSKQFAEHEKQGERHSKENGDANVSQHKLEEKLKSFQDKDDKDVKSLETDLKRDDKIENQDGGVSKVKEEEKGNKGEVKEGKDEPELPPTPKEQSDAKAATTDETSGNLPTEAAGDKTASKSTMVSSVIDPLKEPLTIRPDKPADVGPSTSDGSKMAAQPPPSVSLPGLLTQSPDKRECLYKILVIGELGTGKTSIIKRYVHQFFSQHYRATIGVDFALKVLNWDQNTIIRLQLWDIAGQERFGNMTRVYYKEAVGAFIVFDVTRSATFDAVLKWKQDLDAKVQLADGGSIPCVLLANKCDQQKEGIVNNPARMEEYCKENNFSGWFETSAKENINIDDAAKNLVSQILQNDKVSQNGKENQDGSRFPLDGKNDQESKSCAC